MGLYTIGAIIKELREKNNLTQAELANKLNISDKTVSKWENGKGYPDISLLEPISGALGISVNELMAGNSAQNLNVSANVKRSKFYVCPVCGNIIHTMGEADINCHGIHLLPATPEECDNKHQITLKNVEDEYFVSILHDMTKDHYISFIAAFSDDGLQIKKLYPQAPAQARFKRGGLSKILYYCNRDGLFYYNL